MNAIDPPLALLAELTHRCPLRCPYCSNPTELARASAELPTPGWLSVLDQAAALGVLQVHFSGGEPTARRDLVELVARAERAGLYTNLITAGVSLDAARLQGLAQAGLQHVQISLQDDRPDAADHVAGAAGMHARKLAALDLVRSAGLALTINVVLHRGNIDRAEAIIALAEAAGAGRLELAHVQYHGWALANREALLPRAEQVSATLDIVEAARERLRGRLVIDHVLPDYFGDRPKACMNGWGRRFIVVNPRGQVLPCHHAADLPGVEVPTVADGTLRWIWEASPLFNRFRGTEWMPELCRRCPERERDWGGCRCQAFALTGDMAATDPACALAPAHERIRAARDQAAPSGFVYRQLGGGAPGLPRH
jgi:pyrroloquinoline quinone biosynthesis protein E